MSFYIESFMPGTADTPSIAYIDIPQAGEAPIQMKALLATDVSIQLANQFGNLLPGTEVLAGIAQAVGVVNIPSWIGASVQGWRGTAPIKLNLELFLVNYRPNLGYEEQLKALTRLATVSKSSRDDILGHITHQVHGGYDTNASAFASNLQFLEKTPSMYLQSRKDNNIFKDETNDYLNLAKLGTEVSNRGAAKFNGTLEIRVGNRFKLKDLILTSIAVTPSSVEVYSPRLSERPKPLFYKISMSVMTCRTALSTDVDGMFS